MEISPKCFAALDAKMLRSPRTLWRHGSLKGVRPKNAKMRLAKGSRRRSRKVAGATPPPQVPESCHRRGSGGSCAQNAGADLWGDVSRADGWRRPVGGDPLAPQRTGRGPQVAGSGIIEKRPKSVSKPPPPIPGSRPLDRSFNARFSDQRKTTWTWPLDSSTRQPRTTSRELNSTSAISISQSPVVAGATSDPQPARSAP